MDSFNLPKELIDHIGEFNADHRPKFTLVLIEYMDIVGNYMKTCDNWDCDCILINMENPIIEESIFFQTHYFCCEECAGIGEELIRYEYRRSLRRRNGYT